MLGSIIDVMPKGDNWQVMLADGSRSWRTFSDKGEAIQRAKELARINAGCVVVRGCDGQVQTQRYYEVGATS
jgi:hypothetical protein